MATWGLLAGATAAPFAWSSACAADSGEPATVAGSGAAPTGTGATGGGGSAVATVGVGGGPPCEGHHCAPDLQAIVDCDGNVVEACTGTDGCDLETVTCINACEAAESAQRSVGCDYYATFMDAVDADACFAAVVANIWGAPAHIAVEHNGVVLPVESFAYTTTGQGPLLAYQPFDNTAGLAPGEVAILLLAGLDGTPGVGNPVCPFPSAVPTGAMLHNGTGKGWSFHITTDVPVVVYQINPYGGGSAAETGSSLLLPTSAWDTNYLAVNAYASGTPSLNVIAKEDGTTVEMLPAANIVGGGGLPPGSANGLYTFTLDAGQYVQISQSAPLTGSILESDKPIGVMGGTRCSFVPLGIGACDHLEQTIPPVKALGSRYVAVSHTPRTPGANARWRLVGAVDGTQLTWSADVGGPATLEAGQVAELATQFQFTVESQDADHPFVMMAMMTGGDDNGLMGVGDPEAVLVVPPDQFLTSYVFFADPTYPTSNLVVVRAKDQQGDFNAVTLDCYGTLDGWKSVGGDFEWTRLFLSTGDFELVGNCGAGSHRIFSQGPFGLWIWGWGAPGTSTFTQYVSYGYPGGMNADAINDVFIPPTPK